MTSQERAIYARELVVVNFRTKHFSEDIRGWKECANVAVAESCDRQLWFGFQDDFSDFPGKGRSDIELYEGGEAYEFLLKVFCGLESSRMDRVGNPNIKGQICSGCDQYKTEDAQKKKAIEAIIADIKADSRFVSAAALDGLKPHRHEIAARDLSGQKKSDRILVIGSLNRNDGLSSFTDGICRVTGNKRAARVREIVLTHPDAKTLRAINDFAKELKTKGIITADISRVGFNDLSRAIESADRIYVDIPMGSMPETEEIIVQTWQTRIYRGNTLTHLRGDPNNMGFSSGVWAHAELDNYISPERIREDMTARAHHNRIMIELAHKAISYCTDERLRGEQPSNTKVRDHLSAESDVPAFRQN